MSTIGPIPPARFGEQPGTGDNSVLTQQLEYAIQQFLMYLQQSSLQHSSYYSQAQTLLSELQNGTASPTNGITLFNGIILQSNLHSDTRYATFYSNVQDQAMNCIDNFAWFVLLDKADLTPAQQNQFLSMLRGLGIDLANNKYTPEQAMTALANIIDKVNALLPKNYQYPPPNPSIYTGQ